MAAGRGSAGETGLTHEWIFTAGQSPSDLFARWQTLQLLSPVVEILNRAAPRADFDHRGLRPGSDRAADDRLRRATAGKP